MYKSIQEGKKRKRKYLYEVGNRRYEIFTLFYDRKKKKIWL